MALPPLMMQLHSTSQLQITPIFSLTQSTSRVKPSGSRAAPSASAIAPTQKALGDSGIHKACTDFAKLAVSAPRPKKEKMEGITPVLANSTHSRRAATRMNAPPRRRYLAAAFTGLSGPIAVSDMRALPPYATRFLVIAASPASRPGLAVITRSPQPRQRPALVGRVAGCVKSLHPGSAAYGVGSSVHPSGPKNSSGWKARL